MLDWSCRSHLQRKVRAESLGGCFLRILLVEDEMSAAKILAKGLREQGYAVDIAADGDAALYQAAINDYDVVLLDVMLPGRDGLEVCRGLRAMSSPVPVFDADCAGQFSRPGRWTRRPAPTTT